MRAVLDSFPALDFKATDRFFNIFAAPAGGGTFLASLFMDLNQWLQITGIFSALAYGIWCCVKTFFLIRNKGE
jgi:hypothetical protein